MSLTLPNSDIKQYTDKELTAKMAIHLFDGNREAAKEVYEELSIRDNQHKDAIAAGSAPACFEGIKLRELADLSDRELEVSLYIATTTEGSEATEKFVREKQRRKKLALAAAATGVETTATAKK